MDRRRSRNRLISLALLLSFGASACRSSGTSPPVDPRAAAAAAQSDQALMKLEDAEDGLTLRLSAGEAGAERGEVARRPPTTPLGDAELKKLFARLAPLVGEAADTTAFALRDRSTPPPKTGAVVKGAFPPPPSNLAPPLASAAGKPLEVVRWLPEGEVPLAPNLSVTFSQPMVPITAHADSVAGGVPVALEPQPKGQWRWVGTKTLLFDPEVRFPAATEYVATIAAGTKSENGAVLAAAKTIRFATPPPSLVASWPSAGAPARRDPFVYARFDQRIDPAAVAKAITLVAGGRAHAVRLATDEEIKATPEIARLIADAEAEEQRGRYLVVRPVDLLPAASAVEVVIPKGTPSAEGPRTTASKQGWGFKTYGPLEVTEWRCGWSNTCQPGAPWMIRFSNPLDERAFDPASIEIAPALPGRKLIASGDSLTIMGRSAGRTRYTVTLPADLRDAFDQTLGKPRELPFNVGDADPQLFGASGLTVRDPASRAPTYDVHTINVASLDLQLYRVEPADWPAYVKYMEKNPRAPKAPPGKRVVSTTIKIAGPLDRMAETRIDLSAALAKGGKGHVVVHVAPTTWPDRYRPELDAWVQSTDLALDAFVDSTELLGWATRLADGARIPGATIELAPTGQRGTTDARGLATLALPDRAPGGARQMLIGRRGDDVAFLPEASYAWSDVGGWRRVDQGDALSWMVYDDRRMYRPGEEVHLKGWLRHLDAREGGDLGGLDGKGGEVGYVVRDAQGVEIGKGTARLNALGGFDTAFRLPKTPNLGSAHVELTARGVRADGRALGGATHHGFEIQEFRRPEYEVATTASQGPHLVGAGADVTVKASYYAGGPLASAEVNWEVSSTPTNFTPPGRDDYTFGAWVPWWLGGDFVGPGRGGKIGFPGLQPTRRDSFAGVTDPTGAHVLHMDFLALKPPRPVSLVAEARVTDVNRQSWASQSALLVHPSSLYVGLKQPRLFVERGAPIEIGLIVVDHDGKARAGASATVKAVRLDWTYKNGEYVEEEVDPQTCAITSTDRPSSCRFETREGGTYRTTATVLDERGRPNQTEITTWVSGGDTPPSRDVEQERVTLVPSKQEHAPGDVAELMVQAPFFPAQGLVTVRRSGLVRTESFEMTSATTTLRVPLDDALVPGVTVQVDLVGAAVRADDDGRPQPKLPRRPAYAIGTIDLTVAPVNRTLSVAVKPRAARIEPGGKTSIDVEVKDAAGKPVAGAQMSVVVVDEAVLALSGYATPDPIAAFYGARPGGVADHHLRQYVKLSRAEANALGRPGSGAAGGTLEGAFEAQMTAPAAAAPMEAEGGRAANREKRKMAMDDASTANGGAASGPIAVRTNFDALAVFSPAVATDAAGRATVAIAAPDNLTRYRVMVVAASGENRFGKGEAAITARLPLMVRPSAPRFLSFGDRFALPIVLQNQTDAAMTVDLGVRALNLALPGGGGRRVTVPANDRVEVLVPAAAELAGTARLQVGAASGRWADAAELALPVWTPATTEAFATYGELDAGAVRQAVAMPGTVVETFGGLEVSTSSTQLQALTDAFVHLIQYPYECAEQTTSRLLAIAALRDVLGAFHANGLPGKAEVERIVARDLERLARLQNPDGGFAWWIRGQDSWPYISIHAAHGLVRAKEKGYAVPAGMIEQSRGYLRAIEQRIPHWYPVSVRRSLIAYALYVRTRMGDADPGKARALIAEAGLKALSMDSIGWLLVALGGDAASAEQRASIVRHLENRVSETAGAATFTTSYGDGAYLILDSERRADAILLEALIGERPKSDLIPKLVRGLLGHQKRGRWANTQEDAWVLLAMDRYFHTYEKVTPNFVSRIWFGDGFAGEHAFRGRTTETHQVDVPMGYVAKVGKADLVIGKQGPGRLYYRIGMTYAPASLKLDPADHGFAVTRTYEAVDAPTDVVRRPDGSWRIKAGARVRVRLAMVAEARRTHVALVDPLPAGLEPMNPALAVTGAIPQDPKQQQGAGPLWWWYRTWYEHQNMRDERVEAFTTLLYAGVHEYTYVARATTPGTFIASPAKAEEMYAPETFGRSASDRVVVE